METGVLVRRLSPQAEDWHTLAHGGRGSHLAHAPQWASVIHQAYGHDPLYLAGEDEAGRTGLLPAFIVRRPFLGTVVTSMPFLDGGGPRADSVSLAGVLVQRLIEEARHAGARLVELRCARALPIAAPPMEHKANLVLPLPSDSGEVWQRLDRGARNQIRKAGRSGLSIECGGAEHLDAFYAIFAARMRELGSPVHGKAFFEAILRCFGSDARIALVRQGSQPIGGLVALACNEALTVPWASCLQQYFTLCPNMLLYWETIRAACREGFRRFDFGRSTRGSGTYRFKRQWGAQEEPLFWYTIPVADGRRGPGLDARGLGAEVWRRLPLEWTRRLGPRIRKFLIQ